MEMVTSVVVGEAMSGAVSFMLNSRKEKASQKDLLERLDMAHINLALALEKTRMMPITIIALLRKRNKLKDVFKECDNLLNKARDHQQVVPSFRTKIMHAVLPSFIVPSQDVLSSSDVRRFEWFATEADRFVRDVESGCSLSHYRFLNPLIRHLLQGKDLTYQFMRGIQTRCAIRIATAYMEEYGRIATLDILYEDRKAPLKSFRLLLNLRLYESTNLLEIAAKCLQSLGPQFRSFAEVGTGLLTQVPTQDVSYSDSVWWDYLVRWTTLTCPDPFCCIENGLKKSCADNIISSELTGRFPQEVTLINFNCRFSASGCLSQSSTEPLEMTVTFTPHLMYKPVDRIELKEIFDFFSIIPHLSHCFQYGTSLHNIEEGIQTETVDYFIRHPELKEYELYWDSPHGSASFRVLKPITKSRRVSKRRR